MMEPEDLKYNLCLCSGPVTENQEIIRQEECVEAYFVLA